MATTKKSKKSTKKPAKKSTKKTTFEDASKFAESWFDRVTMIAEFAERGNVDSAYKSLEILDQDYSKYADLLVEHEDQTRALSDGPVEWLDDRGWSGLGRGGLISCWSSAHEAARGVAAMALEMLYWPFFETKLDRRIKAGFEREIKAEVDRKNKAELDREFELRFRPLTDSAEQRAFAERLLVDHWKVLMIPRDELAALRERIRRERTKFLSNEPNAGNRKPPKTNADKPECVWLGECRYQIGDKNPKARPRQYADVLESLVVLRAATTKKLEKHANRSGVSKLLGKLRKNYRELAPYIILPGGKGKGGYQTTIQDGRKKNPKDPLSAP